MWSNTTTACKYNVIDFYYDGGVPRLMENLQTLLETGFVLKALVEPKPDPRLMDVPGMADELRRPMMLLLSAHKPE